MVSDRNSFWFVTPRSQQLIQTVPIVIPHNLDPISRVSTNNLSQAIQHQPLTMQLLQIRAGERSLLIFVSMNLLESGTMSMVFAAEQKLILVVKY